MTAIPSNTDKLQALSQIRQTLKTEFAQAHRDYSDKSPIQTGIDWLDNPGTNTPQLFQGDIFEIQAPAGTSSPTLICELLRHTIQQRQRLVLIDANDSFDPASLPIFHHTDTLRNQYTSLAASFLWMRCRGVDESIRVADLILRDGNLPLVILDLTSADPADLRHVANSSWYRLRSLTEDAGSTCITLTAQKTLPCAARRFQLSHRPTLDDIEGGYHHTTSHGRPITEQQHSNIINFAA